MFRKTFSNIKPYTSSPSIIAGAFIAICIGLGSILIITSPSLHRQWLLSTTHQPEQLTELYFDSPNNLPARLTPGKTVSITYHVHNLEGTQTNYRVRINLVINGHTQTIQENQLTLASNTGSSYQVSFTAPPAHQNVEMVIDLKNTNQTIYFRSST